MLAKVLLFICLVNASANAIHAQSNTCTFKPPFFTLHFGKGDVMDVNLNAPALYERVSSSCPTDGYYGYASYTSNCFQGDWHTLTEDHTPGDIEGNMLLVNSAFDAGMFLSTTVKGFKSETTYQFGVWLMNVCRPTRKCPFPLLPNLTIRLQTPAGKTIEQFTTGELRRIESPQWMQHKAQFTVPPGVTEVSLILLNDAPGGCGNDFVLDDISFRECIKADPPITLAAKKISLVAARQVPVKKNVITKAIPPPLPLRKRNPVAAVPKTERTVPANNKAFIQQPIAIVPVPLILKQRTNSLIEQIKTSEGEVLINLYDNGEIDGDTVSIYHNNALLVSHQQLSQKPISFRIRVSKMQPHHELVMVANNLGSIPPNTSVMIVTTKEKRYQVSISSTEQQNAKVVIELKE